ncbi:MAG: TerB family tellurite resistance protein [Leptospiraceae bacterium]|nr:TerB family tellurite resistance protein [Leptospiraceae bacterium]
MILSMYKLLYILAGADGQVDDSERHYLRSLAFEACLTEQEWREIEYYGQHQASDAEIQALADRIFSVIHKGKDRRAFLQQLREMMAADAILQKSEQDIIGLIEDRATGTGSFLNAFRNLKKNLPSMPASRSDSHARNPVAIVLERYPNLNTPGLAARLGFALAMIHSDAQVQDAETDYLVELIRAWNPAQTDIKAQDLKNDLMQIDPERIELAYLGQDIVAAHDETQRIAFLADLFRMAQADGEIDPMEERDLRVIARYLLLTHKQYIDAKMQAIDGETT